MSWQKQNGDNASSRGIFSAGLLGLMNAVIIFLPVDDNTKVKLATALNPTMALLAFTLWRIWDRMTGGTP